MAVLKFYHLQFLRCCRQSEFMLLLAVRLLLAPVMAVAGFSKLGWNNPELDGFARVLADPAVVQWFGNQEWGLGLPAPMLLATLVGYIEFVGGFALLLGLATRLFALPLMLTMLVAILTVHLPHGWFAIAPADGASSAAQFFSWFGLPGAEQSLQQSAEIANRLSKIRQLLTEHGDIDWLLANGPVAILNNGAEFAVIYLLMLWQLLTRGGGRYLSVDYWISKRGRD
jgi:putative oxidoreductase